MKIYNVPARTHGRVVVREAPYDGRRSRVVLAFHGYQQRAETMIEMLEPVPGIERWTIASVQALHPFYARGGGVVASWMTKEDRELAIAENIEYVDEATVALQRERRADVVVCAGFSQGGAMAWRAGVLGRRRADGIVSIGADIPPELKDTAADCFPISLIAAGTRDEFYTQEKLDADIALLESKGAPHGVLRYDGAHEWTDEVRREIGKFLGALGE